MGGPEDIDRAAHDFVRSNECEVMDTYESHEHTFQMAIRWRDANPLLPPADAQEIAQLNRIWEILRELEGIDRKTLGVFTNSSMDGFFFKELFSMIPPRTEPNKKGKS